jgi:hypothetical protein
MLKYQNINISDHEWKRKLKYEIANNNQKKLKTAVSLFYTKNGDLERSEVAGAKNRANWSPKWGPENSVLR